MNNEIMYCPLCKSKLVFKKYVIVDGICGDERRGKYSCEKSNCEMSNLDSFWDDQGSFYGDISFKRCRELFPNNEYGALNSIAKKHEKTIYKKGLKSKKELHPIFCLFLLKPYIEYYYDADYWGNVTKKWYKLHFLKRNEQGKFSYHYISGVSSFLFQLKCYNRNKKFYKKHKSDYSIKALQDNFEEFNLPEWDKRWHRLLFKFYLKTFEKNTKQELLKIQRKKQKAKKYNIL